MKLFRTCRIVLGLAAVASLAACSTTSADPMTIRADPTPELMTLYERPSDVANNLAIMVNENRRMFWEDLGRALYWDRPSRLTPEPMPR